jgi:hypothetical protein
MPRAPVGRLAGCPRARPAGAVGVALGLPGQAVLLPRCASLRGRFTRRLARGAFACAQPFKQESAPRRLRHRLGQRCLDGRGSLAPDAAASLGRIGNDRRGLDRCCGRAASVSWPLWRHLCFRPIGVAGWPRFRRIPLAADRSSLSKDWLDSERVDLGARSRASRPSPEIGKYGDRAPMRSETRSSARAGLRSSWLRALSKSTPAGAALGSGPVVCWPSRSARYGTSDAAACRTTFAASDPTQKLLWTSSLVSRVTLAR